MNPEIPKGFFVTGTDTGVGKTLVASALLMGMRARGLSVGGMKPVATGANILRNDNGVTILVSEDTEILYRSMHGETPYSLITPCAFPLPASPHLAAQDAGTTIREGTIFHAFREMQKRYPVLIVEGVGGWLVPLRDDWLVADLAQLLNLPVIVVSRPGLGTLNHTLLTLQSIRSRNVPVAGVVFSQNAAPGDLSETWSRIENDNMATIPRLGSVPVLGAIPYLSELDSSDPMVIYARAESYFDWRGILSQLQ
ncbi:MAG TPA: dethiobiotin synthase [bacterium]|nr:dethiobiotin synthase [bacterium]HQO33106.1 dethiobiotin synthase [bacterium]HQP98651.1 dethiobiotin synthase [bacterium]